MGQRRSGGQLPDRIAQMAQSGFESSKQIAVFLLVARIQTLHRHFDETEFDPQVVLPADQSRVEAKIHDAFPLSGAAERRAMLMPECEVHHCLMSRHCNS
jgi:hypothetical protein